MVQLWRVLAMVLTLVAFGLQLLSAGERDTKRFSFVVLGHLRSDADGQVNPLLDELLVKVRKRSPDLVFLTGDLIWGGVYSAAGPDRIKQDWERLDAALAQLGVPVYRVPGNHDIHDYITRDIYFERYGELPRAFTYRGSRFILLNSSWVPEGRDRLPRGSPYVRGKQLGPNQIEFIRQELSEDQRPDHVFLFMHHLLWWHKDEAAWWRDVHPLLVGRNVRAVFGGDFGPMKFSHTRRDGIDYIQSSIEGPPSLKMLQISNSSRLLSQQFDNYLHVTVNGPRADVEVGTVGEFSLGKFTPQHWRAVDEYRPPIMNRVRDLMGNTQRLMILASLTLVCFLAGFVAALILKRKKQA